MPFTAKQVAARLSVPLAQVYRWIDNGSLRAINTTTNPNPIIKSYRITESDLEAFMRDRENRPVRPESTDTPLAPVGQHV